MRLLVLALIIACVAAQCSDCPSCGPVVNPDFPLPGDQSCRAKVVLILDESGSLGEFREVVVAAATAFWTALAGFGERGGQASLGVVEFSTEARIVGQPFLRPVDEAYVAELNSYISTEAVDETGYSPSGTTNWGQALDLAANVFTGDNQPDLVVFFTDGSPNGHAPFECDASCFIFDNFGGDVGNACFKADQLKARGIKVFTVGLGEAAERTFSIPLLGGGDSALAWDLEPSTFGQADYILDPSLEQLLPTLVTVAEAICPPPCQNCLISCSANNVPSVLECTGPSFGTLAPVTATRVGDCGAETHTQSPLSAFTGSCKAGIVTRTLVVQDTCMAPGPQTCTFETEIRDTVGPTVDCPAGIVAVTCEDARCGLESLTATASDLCSGATVSKGPITPVELAPGVIGGYRVEFSAQDGCGNANPTPCVVTYECRDEPAPALTKMAFYRPAIAGGAPVEWSGSASNAGPGVLRGAVLTDQVAAGSRVVATDGEGASNTGNSVRFELGDVLPLQPEPYAIWFGVPANSQETQLDNQARLADSAGENVVTADASVQVVRIIDTWVAIDEIYIEGFPGDPYTFTLTYGNFGPSQAGPHSLLWTPVTSDGGSATGGVAPACTTTSWATLEPHSRGTVTCTGFISGDGLYTWRASLVPTTPGQADEQTTHNNQDTIPILPKPQMSVTKRRVSTDDFTVVWEIVVTNDGPAPLLLESVEDTLYSLNVANPANPTRVVERQEPLEGCSFLVTSVLAGGASSVPCQLTSEIDISSPFWFGAAPTPSIEQLQFINEVHVCSRSADPRISAYTTNLWARQQLVLSEAQMLARVVGDTLAAATTQAEVQSVLSSVGTTQAFLDLWLSLAASGFTSGIESAHGLQTALAVAAGQFITANAVDVPGFGVRRAQSLTYSTQTVLDIQALILSAFDRQPDVRGPDVMNLLNVLLTGIGTSPDALAGAHFLGTAYKNVTVVLSGDAVFSQVDAYGLVGGANTARELAAADFATAIARVSLGCPTCAVAETPPIGIKLCLTEV